MASLSLPSLFELAFSKLNKESISSLRVYEINLPFSFPLFDLYKGSKYSTPRDISPWERFDELYLGGGEKEELAKIREDFLTKNSPLPLSLSSPSLLVEEIFPFTWRALPLRKLVKGSWSEFSQTKLWNLIERKERESLTFLNYLPEEFIFLDVPLSYLRENISQRQLLPIIELKALRRKKISKEDLAYLSSKKLKQVRILAGEKEEIGDTLSLLLCAFYAGNVKTILNSSLDLEEHLENAYLNAWEGFLFHRDLEKFYLILALVMPRLPYKVIAETSRGLPLDIIDLLFHRSEYNYSFLAFILLKNLGYIETCKLCLLHLQNAPPEIKKKILSKSKDKEKLYPLSVLLIRFAFDSLP